VPTTRDFIFWLPKLLDFVEQPLAWVLLLLLVALVLFWRRRQRAALRTVVVATLLLACLGVEAVPEIILQRLEDAYPATTRSPGEFEGVLVLGGGLEGGIKAVERNQTLLGGSAERVTTAVALARDFPNLKIVLTGYAGVNQPGGLSEAQGTVRFFREQGLPTSRLIVEPAARNTAEIAENVKTITGIDPSKPWLLLTSAWNMPRALLAFRKAGWNVEPLPVDYFTGTSIRFARYSIARGSFAWSVALHELLGIAWYRVTGRL
jgi:uncharacterized SAM-binding protein YcdF (DUF218 family)